MSLPFDSKVVGVRYRPLDCRNLYKKLKPKDLLAIVPAPSNPFDKDAMAVYVPRYSERDEFELIHIGYVPAADNVLLEKDTYVAEVDSLPRIRITAKLPMAKICLLPSRSQQ